MYLLDNMEIFPNGKIGLEVEDITSYSVSENTIRGGAKRLSASWRSLRPKNHKLLIDYDTIPATTIKKHNIPTKKELLAQHKAQELALKVADSEISKHALLSLHKTYIKASDFNYFRVERGIADDLKCNELVEAAAWLRILCTVNGPKACQKVGFTSKKELRFAVLEILQKSPIEGLKVSNYRILQNKESDFLKAGKKSDKHALETLISKNYGNKRAQKRDKVHEAILIELYTNPESAVKFRKNEVYFRYVEACLQNNREPLAESTVKMFLKSPKVEAIVAKARHGAKYYDDNFRTFTPRLAPQYSNTHWSGDGTVADLYYRNAKGERTMASFWIWVDWTTKAVVGYDIATQENRHMVRRSLRTALKLNGRHLPIEIQTDNSTAAKEAQNVQLFSRLATFTSFAKPGNAKEKPVERVFDVINNLFRQFPNWKGNNIQSKSIDSKANPDMLPGVELPDLEGVKHQIMQAINVYNNTRLKSGKTRIQEYNEKINPDCQQLDDLTFSYFFDNHTTVTANRGIIKVEVDKQVHEYEIKDIHKKLELLNQRVRVYYDEQEMHTVHLFQILDQNDPSKDKYIESVTKLVRVRGAKSEQTEEDKKLLGYYHRKGKKLDETIDAEIAEALDLLRAEGIVANPFSDFKSRYKDELNTAEAMMFDEMYRDQERASGRKVPVLKAAKIDLYDDGEEGGIIE